MSDRDESRAEVVAVDVWWASIADEVPVDTMDEVERVRWQRYRQELDRRRFALGVAITRSVLGQRLRVNPSLVPLDRTCQSCGADHGPPRVSDSDAKLSVSHSSDIVVVACSSAPVGIDIEWIDEKSGRQEVALAPTLAAAEVAAWSALPEDRRAAAFYTFWARKEAVVKATGDGLRWPFTDLIVSPPTSRPRVLRWNTHPDLVDRLQLQDLGCWPGYAAAVAVIASTAARIQIRPWR